jgi:hypothetical protein
MYPVPAASEYVPGFKYKVSPPEISPNAYSNVLHGAPVVPAAALLPVGEMYRIAASAIDTRKNSNRKKVCKIFMIF